jgi:hypothetical protein
MHVALRVRGWPHRPRYASDTTTRSASICAWLPRPSSSKSWGDQACMMSDRCHVRSGNRCQLCDVRGTCLVAAPESGESASSEPYFGVRKIDVQKSASIVFHRPKPPVSSSLDMQGQSLFRRSANPSFVPRSQNLARPISRSI